MPVRNGMPYLPEALSALAGQDLAYIEVVICDNASVDGTADVCRAWAERDPRFRYLPFSEDAGASANFNRAFRLTTGDLFTWAAHDDRFHPRFLAACRDPV